MATSLADADIMAGGGTSQSSNGDVNMVTDEEREEATRIKKKALQGDAHSEKIMGDFYYWGYV